MHIYLLRGRDASSNFFVGKKKPKNQAAIEKCYKMFSTVQDVHVCVEYNFAFCHADNTRL